MSRPSNLRAVFSVVSLARDHPKPRTYSGAYASEALILYEPLWEWQWGTNPKWGVADLASGTVRVDGTGRGVWFVVWKTMR